MDKHTKQPVIGIVPCFDNGEVVQGGSGVIERVFLRRDYLEKVAAVGAIPLIIHPSMVLDTIINYCDGVVISGGYDIDPELYGKDRLPEVEKTEPIERFEWEKSLIEKCDETKTPILGICYGMQRLNVHYGGTLLQDIPRFIPATVGHDRTEHQITIDGSFLGLTGSHMVASRHHQALDTVADGFQVKATTSDGVLEAIEGRGHFGIQWHPESDASGVHVYRAFVEHCVPRI